jgi:hypothetical protein
MGWFKKVTKGISKVADDALGFDPNGGGFVPYYNIAGMATVGAPVGSIGSASVNVLNGDMDKALKQGLNGVMAYGAGSLGGMGGSSGGLGGLGGMGGILGGGGQQTQGGTVIAPQSPNVNIIQDTPIQKMALLNNQSPLTSKPRKELTDMLLNNLKAKHGGVNG